MDWLLDPSLIPYVLLAGALCYLIGSWRSPLAVVERQAKSTWQGQAGFYKKKLEEVIAEVERQANAPMDSMMEAFGVPKQIRPVLSPILNRILGDPKLMEALITRGAKFLGIGQPADEGALATASQSWA